MHAITSECVMLTCEVDRGGRPVHWFKDGQEVEESDFVLLESEGPHHRRAAFRPNLPSGASSSASLAMSARALLHCDHHRWGSRQAMGWGSCALLGQPAHLLGCHSQPPQPITPHPFPQPMVCTLRFSHCRTCIVLSALVTATWQREAHLSLFS